MRRVQILAGMTEFIGQTGTVIGEEKRVRGAERLGNGLHRRHHLVAVGCVFLERRDTPGAP